MLGLGLVVLALILGITGLMTLKGDAGIDSRGNRVGPPTQGSRGGWVFIVAAAVAAAAAAWILTGHGFG